MKIEMFKSKIHRARVTGADPDYMGSVTVDRDLLDAARILPGEKVQIVNVTNGERIETYTIAGQRGSGEIVLNGAAAHKFSPGDIVIIISYACVTPEEAQSLEPVILFPDEHNRIK